jgi:hypothetical protein
MYVYAHAFICIYIYMNIYAYICTGLEAENTAV